MIEYILFVVGFILLIKGAGYLVDGSSSLAKRFGVPALIIGLTIVALGTTMPELIVNITSAIKGNTDIALGTVIGSNITNILLVLGLISIITPLRVHYSTLWKEIPFFIIAVVILITLANDIFLSGSQYSFISRNDGIILICFFAIFFYFMFNLAKRDRRYLDSKKIKIKKRDNITMYLMIIFGILGILIGGKWVVDGTILIARQLGLSEFMISATIVAFGTSLPELVTAITATIKKNMDIAIGNIIGANILNIFWVLGIASVIKPIQFIKYLNLDLLFLIVISFLFFFFVFVGKRNILERKEGIIFVGLYIAYIIFNIVRG